MSETKLGKIQKVRLGPGGYQDACFGVNFTLGGESWGVCDFWGTWENRSESAQYSIGDWERSHLNAYFKLQTLMKEAKVNDLNDLVGKPIEVVFQSNTLQSWRILKEVL